jgi:hypothetical protein
VTLHPATLAIPWILEEDWPKWSVVERDVPSYQRWVELFDKNLKLAEAKGWPYQRVAVRPDPFLEWCKTNQRAADRYARSVYAFLLLTKRWGPGLEPPPNDKKINTPIETLA